MKKYRNKCFIFLVIASLSILNACGGGGSSSSSDSPATGTAYYVDSAVSGIDYECGSVSGVTGENGEFTFERGANCTFYLGSVPLKEIIAEKLEDGGTIQETDTRIAQILQSLDEDGDPSNGITIDAEIIEDLADSGITSLPDTEEEIAALLDAVQTAVTDNGGAFVTSADAEAHQISTILASNALIDVGYDGEPVYNSLTFATGENSNELSTVSWTAQLATESGSASVTLGTTTESDETIITLAVTENGETENYILSLVVDDGDSYYIEMQNEDDNHIERLYLDTEKAESYLVSRILAGHTLYEVNNDDAALESWQFAEDLSAFTWQDENDGDTEALSFDGLTLSSTESDGGTSSITVTDITPTYLAINIVADDGADTGTGRIYYSQAEALEYQDSLNGDDPGPGTDLAFTEDMISGQTWYTSDFSTIAFSGDDNSVVITELMDNTTENANYSINSEGKLVLSWEDAGETETTITLVSQGTDSFTATIVGEDTETVTLYTSRSVFQAATMTGRLSSNTITQLDDTDDSADEKGRPGFELTSLSVKENEANLIVTLAASGNMQSALTSTPESGYNNILWITLNGYEFGISGNDTNGIGDAWFHYSDEENDQYIEIDSSSYSYGFSADGTSLVLTVNKETIPAYDYLIIRGESANDLNEGNTPSTEGDDEHSFDEIDLGALWSNDEAAYTASVKDGEAVLTISVDENDGITSYENELTALSYEETVARLSANIAMDNILVSSTGAVATVLDLKYNPSASPENGFNAGPGPLTARIRVRTNGTTTTISPYVDICKNSTCQTSDDKERIIPDTNTTDSENTLVYGTEVTLANVPDNELSVQFNEENEEFVFAYGSSSAVISLAEIFASDTLSSGNYNVSSYEFKKARIKVMSDDEAFGDSLSVTTSIDNVYVNGSLYDDFSSSSLNTSLWDVSANQ